MNLYHRRYLRHYNATRQPWGNHTRPARRAINWFGLVLPGAIAVGAMLVVPLMYMLLAWLRTL
jgi:hypothetical protein